MSILADLGQAVMGEEIWVDPTEEESKGSSGTVVLSGMPALGTITNVWQSGSMAPADAIRVSHPPCISASRTHNLNSVWRRAKSDTQKSTPSLHKHFL